MKLFLLLYLKQEFDESILMKQNSFFGIKLTMKISIINEIFENPPFKLFPLLSNILITLYRRNLK